MVVDNVDTCPVNGYNDIVLGQGRSTETVGFVESGEEQRPFVHGVIDDVFFDFDGRDTFAGVIALKGFKKKAKSFLIQSFFLN